MRPSSESKARHTHTHWLPLPGQVATAVAGVFASRRHKRNAKRRCLAHAQTSRSDAPDLRTEDYSLSVQTMSYYPGLPQKYEPHAHARKRNGTSCHGHTSVGGVCEGVYQPHRIEGCQC